MASTDRSVPAVIEQNIQPLLVDLQRHAGRYAFFQAMRRLRKELGSEQALREGVRVRPALSLAFPDTDLQKITASADGHVHIEANFFGLYGVSSPLPTFYTEDLIDEAMQGDSAMRDFLDIIHAALYPLLYQAWEKYRLWLQVGEQGQTRRLNQLFALIGLADTPGWEDDARAMLPVAGILNVQPRSAASLQALLQNLLQGVEVQVLPCVERWISVPEAFYTRLGQQACELGSNTILGSEIRDCAGNLDLVVGPVSARLYHALLPGEALSQRIARVIAWFLPATLRVQLKLFLNESERHGVNLGKTWSRLGYNSWLGSSTFSKVKSVPVSFPLNSTEAPSL